MDGWMMDGWKDDQGSDCWVQQKLALGPGFRRLLCYILLGCPG